MMTSPSIAELSHRLESITVVHKQWQRTIGTHLDEVIHTLSAHLEALKRERVEYERQAFTEPIAVLNDQLDAAREEYQEFVRDFVPDKMTRDPRVFPLVPVVCSVFHTHDTVMDAEGGVGRGLPWDVVGGVNAVLFSRRTVRMTIEEYHKCQDDVSGHNVALAASAGDDMMSFTPAPPLTGTGITLDMSGLQPLECLRNYFLNPRRGSLVTGSLSAIRFGSSLRSIAEIPIDFCSHNRSLENLQIDEDSLLNVVTIGMCFLAGCQSLRSVDFRPFRNVTMIEAGFLYNCKALESIDLSPFQQVTGISYEFLSGCCSLAAIDLSPLRSVTSVIFSGWLEGCCSLRGTIDLTPLRGVTDIDTELDGFLHLDTTDDTPVRILVPADNRAVVDAVRESIADYDAKWRQQLIIEEVLGDVEIVEGRKRSRSVT